jgi:hypothetical protein
LREAAEKSGALQKQDAIPAGPNELFAQKIKPALERIGDKKKMSRCVPCM